VSPKLRKFIDWKIQPPVLEANYGLCIKAISGKKCEKDWGKRKEAHVKGKGGTKKIKGKFMLKR
jgi:hypothetical protein